MPKYKLLALDIDGTTITDNQHITTPTRFWIKRAIDSGVTVIFATGRGLHRVEHLANELQLSSPMVLLNGAEVWEGTDQLLERHYLEEESVHRLYRIALENKAHFWGYDITGLVSHEDWTEEMLDRSWMKVSISHTNSAVLDELKRYADRLGTVEIAQTDINNLEITPKGRTKEAGVKSVCEILGIKMEQVIAIGDELNDLPLLRGAGLGVAMGNANEEIKRAANVITNTNEQDGVAKAIQRYLFGLDSID
jgi:Cof subfamily protein (haloacid dehalogenase superfamily)